VTVHGFDISHWNGTPSFDRVPAMYEFGMVKATQDTSYRDPQYLRNVTGMHNSGRLVGAYHFLTVDDPTAQARWFASVIGKQGKGYLPPVVDYEGSVLKLGPVEGARRLLAFMREVDRLTGRTCGIYLSDSTIAWLGGPLWAQVTAGGRFIWDARYGRTAAHGCHVQQTAQYGTVAGIGNGVVDLDEFRGTLTQLRRWALIYPVVNVKRLLRLSTPYMHGADVLEVQRALIKRGYKVVADNVYGPKTADAVGAFKRTVKWLPHNSIVGPGTRKALGI
jgi:GH25 family lysozyme M1 (1,4-beta-N-acetylmuramidase)